MVPKETDYIIKAAEWRLLDTGNPAFQPVNYEKSGKNMQASYRVQPGESPEEYWARVRADLAAKRRLDALGGVEPAP